ncbi:MAG: hypothetical protein EOP05_23615 [Proteobacteria bacterium]|nr:MAG: hypothetical protein EOP05_23615 [Pseudomonadota bacterium]
MISYRELWLPLIACFALTACATDDSRMGTENTDWYAASNADPASFGITDGFSFNKKQKVRSANDYKFYYKRCALGGDRVHYSRTSYWCTDPF